MANHNSYEFDNYSGLFPDSFEDSYLGQNDWFPLPSPLRDPAWQEDLETGEIPRGCQLPKPSDGHASKLILDVESLSPSCENGTAAVEPPGLSIKHPIEFLIRFLRVCHASQIISHKQHHRKRQGKGNPKASQS